MLKKSPIGWASACAPWKYYKARMLAKLGVDGVPQLVRLSLGLTETG